MSIYAVVDTNVIVSAFITKNPQSPTIKIWQEIPRQRMIILHNEEILSEYSKVLSRAKFNIETKEVNEAIEVVKESGLEVQPKITDKTLIDSDDQIFYDTMMAYRHKSAYLITGNKKHFPSEDYIVTPAEMMNILNKQ